MTTLLTLWGDARQQVSESNGCGMYVYAIPYGPLPAGEARVVS